MNHLLVQTGLWPTSNVDVIEVLSNGTKEERGAIYTKPQIVEYMLDLAGFTCEKELYRFQTLEPSCGSGEFILAIARRVIVSYLRYNPTHRNLDLLSKAITGIEVSSSSIAVTSNRLTVLLNEYGFSANEVSRLLDCWLIQADFLSHMFMSKFDFVFGNPPYIRYDNLLAPVKMFCKENFTTFKNRCDLYVPFFERSLALLKISAIHSFICSNRWMKSKYGAVLRSLVIEKYSLDAIVDLEDVNPFEDKVSAYPAITLISKAKYSTTFVKKEKFIESLSVNKNRRFDGFNEIQLSNENEHPWNIGNQPLIDIVECLQKKFKPIGKSCKIGIGVATGADKVYIGKFSNLIENTCRVPLVRSSHIRKGKIEWTEEYVLNPFENTGTRKDLERFPKLKKYLLSHQDVIRNRNCAKKNIDFWYRTIDKISPDLISKSKILIPDIKCDSTAIVVDEGKFYPHHSLYYITSDSWDIHGLAYLLRNGLAALFVKAYANTMRGGYHRFQAQYLKLIHLPLWNDLSSDTKELLVQASRAPEKYDAIQVIKKSLGISLIEARLIVSLGVNCNGN